MSFKLGIYQWSTLKSRHAVNKQTSVCLSFHGDILFPFVYWLSSTYLKLGAAQTLSLTKV